MATPPLARIAWISATARALPMPPTAGISAPRQARVRVTETSSSGLSATFTCSSLSPAPPIGGRARGRDQLGDACVLATAGSPMWKSAPSGSAISSRNTVPSDRPVIRRTTSPTR